MEKSGSVAIDAPGDRQKQRLLFIARVVIAIGLLYLLFLLKVDLKPIVERIRAASGALILAAIGLGIVGELMTALKWQLLLRSIQQVIPFRKVVRASFVGMFYNLFLPGSVGGDVARAATIASSAGGYAKAGATVFQQRNTGLAGLLIVANVAVWLTPIRLRLFPHSYAPLNDLRVWFGVIATGFVAINLVILGRSSERWLECLLSSGPPWLKRLSSFAGRLHTSLIETRGALQWSLILSVVTQLVDCGIVFLIARALALEVSFWHFCIFAPAVSVAALIPITIQGIGVREAVYVTLLGVIGISASAAVSISLLYYVVLLVFAGIGAACAIGLPTQRQAGTKVRSSP